MSIFMLTKYHTRLHGQVRYALKGVSFEVLCEKNERLIAAFCWRVPNSSREESRSEGAKRLREAPTGLAVEREMANRAAPGVAVTQ